MRYLYILAAISCLLSCREKIQRKEIQIPDRYMAIDTTDGKQYIAILKNKDKNKNADLSEKEMILVDSLIKIVVEKYNDSAKINFEERKKKEPKVDLELSNLTIDLKKYKRQYSTTINQRKQKQVFVNCFCQVRDNEEWKVEEVIVKDGGRCYFNLLIDLSKKEIKYFSVNGSA